MKMQGPRVAVIGLDCGTPQLLFDQLADEVPAINELMKRGMHGSLESVTPPITIPAWACSMSGQTPGQLAVYGMRNRKDTSYDGLSLATSHSIREPQVWDVLGQLGMKSLLIGVPPGYPVRPVEGWRQGIVHRGAGRVRGASGPSMSPVYPRAHAPSPQWIVSWPRA